MRGQGLFLSKEKGTERTREGRKWVFCPVQTPAFHTNPGITNQHANAYFLPCSILFPRECASPSPLPWRPLAHIQGSCILCCSGTARMRAFCCKPRRSHQRRTGRQPTGGKPAMAGSQHAPSSRQEPHGGTCGTCFYVCIHTQQWAILWTVFLHLPSLAETRHTNNQHLHHYRRRASTALLEAHAGHATPTKRARGQADRWWAGWDHEALRRAQRPVRKRSLRYLFGPEGCVRLLWVMPCHTQVETGTDRRTTSSFSPPPGNFPCTFVSPAACDTTQHERIHTCAARPASHSTRLTTTHTQQDTPKHA